MVNELKKGIIALFFIIGILLYSCKTDNYSVEPAKMVKEWIGKEIIFPQKTTCFSMNKDTSCISPSLTPYKILVYTDSVGCISCKLDLYKWNKIIEEVKNETKDLVNFQFYFHPKDINEMYFLFRRDAFRYPSHIDIYGRLNKLNNLPTDSRFQTFLLDKDNKVLLIGNPVKNIQIWDLYKRIIKGEDIKLQNPDNILPVTSLELEKKVLDLKGLAVNKATMAKFSVKNVGVNPLIITNVGTACGCTVPEWIKQPVLPSRTAEIVVYVTPESCGYFEKKVTIYCNIKEKYITLAVRGIVEGCAESSD